MHVKEMNALIKDIVNLIPEHVYWLDKEMVFLGCNQAQAKSIGLKSPSQIIGKTIYDFQSKTDAIRIVANIKKVMKTKKTLEFQEVSLMADGSKAYFISKKSPLFDKNRKVIGIIGVSFNITKNKESQDKKEIIFEKLISNLPAHIYWLDTKGNVLGCNEKQAKSAGFKNSKAIIGKNVYDILPSKGLRKLKKTNEKVMSSKTVQIIEEPLHWKDGGSAVMLSYKIPLQDTHKKVSGILGVSVDITEQKKLEKSLIKAKEKAEAASKAKLDFLAIIAHELRTPLHAMVSGVDHFYRHSGSKVSDNYGTLKSMENASNLLLENVNQILDYTKLKAGKVEFHWLPFDLFELLEECIDLLTAMSNKKRIALALTQYDAKLPRYFIGDPVHIRRIIINLISNAIKFTDKGGVYLTVNCIEKNKQHATMSIAVRDTGVGIPEEARVSIFEEFSQVKSGHDTGYSGTGLGLAIVLNLVNNFGGDIKVDGVLGEGSTFTVNLPLELQLGAPVQLSAQELIPAQTKILIVDDDRDRAEVMRHQVNFTNIFMCKSGDSIQVLTDDTEFNVVIVEASAKKITPQQLLTHIKQTPALSHIKLILNAPITPHYQKEILKKEGFFGFLINPVHPSELLRIIKLASEALNLPAPVLIEEEKPSYQVLLVEDNEDIRHITGNLLNDMGCQVEFAEHSDEAFKHLQEKSFDIIFLDLNMGPNRMSGFEIAKEIRHAEESAHHRKKQILVAMTAHIDDDRQKRCIDAGMDDVVSKPFNMDQIQAVFDKWLG